MSSTLPLIERKFRFRSIVRKGCERLLYCDHIEQDGDWLFRIWRATRVCSRRRTYCFATTAMTSPVLAFCVLDSD